MKTHQFFLYNLVFHSRHSNIYFMIFKKRLETQFIHLLWKIEVTVEFICIRWKTYEEERNDNSDDDVVDSSIGSSNGGGLDCDNFI